MNVTTTTDQDGNVTQTVTESLQSSSIEVTRNAKGQVQYVAKLYLDAEHIEEGPQRIKAVTDAIETLYAGRLAGES